MYPSGDAHGSPRKIFSFVGRRTGAGIMSCDIIPCRSTGFLRAPHKLRQSSSRCSLQNQERGSAGNEIRISALPLSWFLALPSRTLYHDKKTKQLIFSRFYSTISPFDNDLKRDIYWRADVGQFMLITGAQIKILYRIGWMGCRGYWQRMIWGKRNNMGSRIFRYSIILTIQGIFIIARWIGTGTMSLRLWQYRRVLSIVMWDRKVFG